VLCRVICTLLFLAWTAEPPIAADPVLYCGLWRSPLEAFGFLFVSVPGLGLTVWQILMLVLAPVSLLWPGARRRKGTTPGRSRTGSDAAARYVEGRKRNWQVCGRSTRV